MANGTVMRTPGSEHVKVRVFLESDFSSQVGYMMFVQDTGTATYNLASSSTLDINIDGNIYTMHFESTAGEPVGMELGLFVGKTQVGLVKAFTIPATGQISLTTTDLWGVVSGGAVRLRLIQATSISVGTISIGGLVVDDGGS